MGLVACQPDFPHGATIQTAVEGDGVRLTWSPGRAEADRTLVSYRIDVDGAEVSRIDAADTSCVLTGLAEGEQHAVEVTVYDSSGEWSGDSGFVKSLGASVVGPAGSTAGDVRCEVVEPPAVADLSVVLSQPAPGAGTLLITGQVAPIDYVLTVTNAGNAASGEVVITNPIPAGTSLVADSPSCGTAIGCSVESADGAVQWTLPDVPAATAVTVGFSVAMDPEIGSITTITSQASYTDQTGSGCETDCTTNAVTNPAERWAWIDSPVGDWAATIPLNVVFFTGIHHFRAVPKPTNDPAAAITYDWNCIPDYLCHIQYAYDDKVAFEFVWDEYENTDLVIVLTATATQGDRQATRTAYQYFRLIESGH
jgi:uncharacterized repeat protein (TIGR01451 family)